MSMADATNSIFFGQGVAAAGSVNLAAAAAAAAAAAQQMVPGAGMTIPAGLSSLLFGGVQAPLGNMVQPGGYMQASAGYSTMANVMHAAAWNGGVAPVNGEQQPPAVAGNGVQRPQPHRGPWSEEEDETLKDLVKIHGERKWAVICKFLPGRIGKQCRERWTNHLRPGVDKGLSVWTEQDDQALIYWHKVYGNRWSLIAKKLEGRSENAVKNHWNATRRSLKAKRRLKKKKNVEAAPGQQWTELENYIRNLPPAVAGGDTAVAGDPADPPAPPASDDSPPSSYNTGYNGELMVNHNVDPMAAGFDYSAAAMGMYLAGGSSSAAAANMGAMMNYPNMAALPQEYLQGLNLNGYYGAGQMIGQQDQQALLYDAASYGNNNNNNNNNQLITYPLIDHLEAWNPAVYDGVAQATNANANAGHDYYYGNNEEAGPSGTTAAADQEDGDVVQLAAMEFMNPSEDDVTLRLSAFM